VIGRFSSADRVRVWLPSLPGTGAAAGVAVMGVILPSLTGHHIPTMPRGRLPAGLSAYATHERSDMKARASL
jgi:hypothetical protein